jgi:hypothetical protein
MIKTTTIVLVFLGALLFCLLLHFASKFQNNLRHSDELRRKWRVILDFILFFIIGSLAFGTVLIFDFPFHMDLMMGIALFAGAFLIFLIVRQVRVLDTGRNKRLKERMSRLNDCLLGLSQRHGDNIERLARLCGESLEGAYALYTRIEEGRIHTLAAWNAPDGFKRVDSAEGRLCTEVVR